MKYFLLRPSYVDDDIKNKYSDIARNLEQCGDEVLNTLDDKWESHLKENYEIDSHFIQTYLDCDKPSFETYSLLKNLIAISVHDYLITPIERTAASEKAQFEVAVAAHKIIIQYE